MTKRRAPTIGVDLASNETAAATAPVDARVDSKGRRWTRVKCKTCGRAYDAAYKVSEGPPTTRCCGGLHCHAVQHWTNEEWELRARSAGHHPTSRPWALLRHSPNSACTWCMRPLGIYVLPVDIGAPLVPNWQPHHDRVVACVGCQQVVRTFQATPSASDLVDAEALRRYPPAPTASVDAAA